MSSFFLLLVIAAAIGIGLLAWTYTKSGKKWLSDL